MPHKSNVFYDYEDFSNRFSKLTASALAVPMIIIAFPILNAYSFTEDEMTGMKLMDGMIGGLLGIVGWPLAPFLACYAMFKVLFDDEPPEPLPIDPAIKEKAKREIGLNCENFYNVAVVGTAGTGKSTLVNGILGLQDSDHGAAPTGETEKTTKPKGYKHPDLRTMIVWDMPGAGTESHPAETYFEDKFLCAFDTLIIVISDR
ncbi:interferon-inducible GTPase-domain-containing protein [Dichotomocladium elegans]|nr:interferon-inducible GTPase-domain-containing protein [Dichotomocladium elegans]